MATLLGLASFSSGEAAAQIVAITAPEAGLRGVLTYTIPPSDGVNIDTANDVIIARSADRVFAFALQCPHQNTALRWNAKDHRFQCPKHKSRYAGSGEFLDGRATRNMDRLAVSLDGGGLAVDNTHEIRSDQEPAKWASAFVHLVP